MRIGANGDVWSTILMLMCSEMCNVFHSSLLHLQTYLLPSVDLTRLRTERLGAFPRIAQQVSDRARNKRQAAAWLPQQCLLQAKLKFGPVTTRISQGKSPHGCSDFPRAQWSRRPSRWKWQAGLWKPYRFFVLKLTVGILWAKAKEKWSFFLNRMIYNFSELGKN